MGKSIKQFAYALAGSSLIVAIWSIGWILYDKLQLWSQITNVDYQNILLAVMATQMALWMIAVAKTKTDLTSLDKKELNKIFQRANKKLTPKIDEYDNELAKLKETVADLKVALTMAPNAPTEATK